MTKNKSIIGGAFMHILWIIVFLGVILLLNVFSLFVDNQIVLTIISLVNTNILLLIGLAVVFFVAEIFERLAFPFNLPAPIFEGVGAIGVLFFIEQIIIAVFTFANIGLSLDNKSRLLVYAIIFLIVLVRGYWHIFFDMGIKKYHSKKHVKR